jgi:hypothetical protein
MINGQLSISIESKNKKSIVDKNESKREGEGTVPELRTDPVSSTGGVVDSGLSP